MSRRPNLDSAQTAVGKSQVVNYKVSYMWNFASISTALALWHTYDPKVKADLFSTALAAGNGLTIVDPIALPARTPDRLESLGRVATIVITNANHVANAEFRTDRLPSIFAPPELSGELPYHQLA